MHENREISSAPWSDDQGRSAKAMNRTADMHALEKSDCAVLPVKQPNKEGRPSAEAVEGRAQTKENIVQSHMHPTLSGKRMSQGLGGVRKAARERKQERFSALLHHLSIELLRESFYALQRKASPGVDGVTWQEYETGLEDRLAFHPNFTYGKDITAYLVANGVGNTPLSVEIEGEGPIYRPHRNEVLVGNKTVTMLAPETFTTMDRDGEPSAVTWILHNEYLGSLPKSTMISGWRLRSGDIQVGGNDILEELFPESRFNSWTVAETHVLSKKIVPNGRRDNYENSAHLSDLLTRLTPTAKEIAHRCRVSSISRNAVQRHEADLSKCEESIAIASKPRIQSR